MKLMKTKNVLKKPMLNRKELKDLNNSINSCDYDVMCDCFFKASDGKKLNFNNYVSCFRDFYKKNSICHYDIEKICYVFGLEITFELNKKNPA